MNNAKDNSSEKIMITYFVTLLIQWIVIAIFGDMILSSDSILFGAGLVFVAIQLFVGIYPFYITRKLKFNWKTYILSIFIWISLNVLFLIIAVIHPWDMVGLGAFNTALHIMEYIIFAFYNSIVASGIIIILFIIKLIYKSIKK